MAQQRLGLNAETQPGWSEPPLSEAQETGFALSFKNNLLPKARQYLHLGFVCLRYTSGAAAFAQRLAEWD